MAAVVIYWQLRRHARWPQVLGAVVLATYAWWICSVAFFPIPTRATVAAMSPEELQTLSWVNLVPFQELVSNVGRLSAAQILRQHGGNVLLFAPFTLLAPLLWSRLRTWRWPLIVGLGGSVTIELVQLLASAGVGYPYRQADIDDVILNTLGAFLGYAVYPGIARSARRAGRLS